MEDLVDKIQEYLVNSELHYDDVMLGIPVEILIHSNNCLEICEIGKSYDDKLRIKFKEEYKNIKEVCEKIKDIKENYILINTKFEKKACNSIIYLINHYHNDIKYIINDYLIKKNIYFEKELFGIKTRIQMHYDKGCDNTPYGMFIFNEKDQMILSDDDSYYDSETVSFETLDKLIEFYGNLEKDYELITVNCCGDKKLSMYKKEYAKLIKTMRRL
jgi:hypothetical protein